MASLPIIIGFGGYNAAGRSSFHHAYQRLIIESLSLQQRQSTLANLAVLMGLVTPDGEQLERFIDGQGRSLNLTELDAQYSQVILKSTLVRRIEKTYFDVDAVPWQQNITLDNGSETPITFDLSKKLMPRVVPDDWQVDELDQKTYKITLTGPLDVKFNNVRDLSVKGAGQFPSGFTPSQHYNSRFHPRSLQMAILGASDAINSTGIPWQTIADAVSPDEVAVYSSNIMGQLDEAGLGGMLNARLKGKRITSKQCPLGHNSMTADFINAYVLGSVGSTGSITGACASFLYNLKAGMEDIQSGRKKVVLVGNSETPITSEIIDGYASMGALASEEGLRHLDKTDEVDLRRSSRPFSDNCGFTIAESSQYVVLMDDSLAMTLGANIYGAVTDVFVNADGIKQSISTPGAGNMITMAKAVASAQALLGERAIREHSFVQAHGSSTPLNRVTESKIYHKIAQTFGIKSWPICAVKSYLGHSLAAASGDQLAMTLGVFAHGVIPKVNAIDHIAEDVFSEHLHIPLEHISKSPQHWQVAFLNSKGFGGNNASAVVLAPSVVKKMMVQRHGDLVFKEYESRLAFTQEQALQYDKQASMGDLNAIYRYGEPCINEEEIQLTQETLTLPGFMQNIQLPTQHAYQNWLSEEGEEARLLARIRS
jgi:acetoacetyl-[acyl-carrier protein] synthase